MAVCPESSINLVPVRGLLCWSRMGASTEDMSNHWGAEKRTQIGAIYSFPVLASRLRLEYTEERQSLGGGWVTNGFKPDTD